MYFECMCACSCIHCVVTDHYSLMLSSVLLMICYSSHVDEILRGEQKKKARIMV